MNDSVCADDSMRRERMVICRPSPRMLPPCGHSFTRSLMDLTFGAYASPFFFVAKMANIVCGGRAP